MLTSGGGGGGGVVSGSGRHRNRGTNNSNNNQSNRRHREENNNDDVDDVDEEELEPEEDEEDDNGSDNNISVTSCSPVTVRREPPPDSQRRGPETSSIDEDNEATNIIITNNASSVRSPSRSPGAGGGENGLLRRKSQLLGSSRRDSVSPVEGERGGVTGGEPTTVGAFTSLIQRNSDTLAKHAASHYLKTGDLLAGFSSPTISAPVGGSTGSGGSHHQSSFNPSLAAQLFLQTSQPLLPPPSQWLYTQLYGANYGDFSWFRNSLSGSSAFRSVSAASASLSPESSAVMVEQLQKSSRAREESDGERSLDRMSPPVTSTSKRSPSPDDGNGTEEEEADVIRAPMAKKIDTLGAFTRTTAGSVTGEKQATSDVWRPY